VIFIISLMGILTGCTSNNNDKSITEDEDIKQENSKNQDNNSKNEILKGSLTMSGSTSMEKLANIASEAFMIKYPNVLVSAEFVGSSAGVEQVLTGAVDIGNASRSLKDSEKASGAVENIVAIDGIAVIVDKSNGVSNLSKKQLIDIYTGVINNWSEVGGKNQPIVVIGREAGSGTRGAFEEILEIEDKCKYSNEINSTGGVMAKVSSIPGAIGYVSIDIIDDSVNVLAIEGVEASAENIKGGNYLLSRPFVMATKGEISKQNEIIQEFFSFLASEEGKKLIESVGLIPAE
jgi:phosphate transport system substrate-binding protein